MHAMHACGWSRLACKRDQAATLHCTRLPEDEAALDEGADHAVAPDVTVEQVACKLAVGLHVHQLRRTQHTAIRTLRSQDNTCCPAALQASPTSTSAASKLTASMVCVAHKFAAEAFPQVAIVAGSPGSRKGHGSQHPKLVGRIISHQPAALLQRGLLGLLKPSPEDEVTRRLEEPCQPLPPAGGAAATACAGPIV